MQNKILLISALGAVIILAGCGVQKNTDNYGYNANNQQQVDNSNYGNSQQNNSQDLNNNSAATSGSQTTMPEMTINPNKSYTVTLKTSEGDIEIALTAKETPITANNFVSLAKKGFYDNVIFHRVIKGFMIQGGDPTGTGSGGPGYKFDDEKFTGEYTRGTVAMANSGPNTNGSQFFIMHADVPLQKDYVIFGHVIKGMEVVDKIATAQTTLGSDGAMSKPVNPVKIISTSVVEK